jgi:hypothetical protein
MRFSAREGGYADAFNLVLCVGVSLSIYYHVVPDLYRELSMIFILLMSTGDDTACGSDRACIAGQRLHHRAARFPPPKEVAHASTRLLHATRQEPQSFDGITFVISQPRHR